MLEYCDKLVLISREQYYIDTLKPFFNVCLTAGSTLGINHTMPQSARDAISKAHKGKPRGYSVTVYKGGSNVNSKRVERTDINGVKKYMIVYLLLMMMDLFFRMCTEQLKKDINIMDILGDIYSRLCDSK